MGIFNLQQGGLLCNISKSPRYAGKIKMKVSRLIIIWIFGVICGIIFYLSYQSSHSPLVKISIKNNSNIVIDRIVVQDNNKNNKYLLENLNPHDSTTTSIYAEGEISYSLTIIFKNNNQLNKTVYAEPGYHDKYIINSDTIEYLQK